MRWRSARARAELDLLGVVIPMRTTLCAQLAPPAGRVPAGWGDPTLPSWSGEAATPTFPGALGIQGSPRCPG